MTQKVKTFSPWALICQSWQIVKKNLWQIVGLQITFGLIYLALLSLINIVFPTTNLSPWYYHTANSIAAIATHMCFSLGVVTLSLQFAGQKSVAWKDFFSKMHIAVPYFLASFVAGISTVLGLICLIIPGMIIYLRLSLFSYFMIDKNMGPIEALKASWYLVKGVTWKVLGFWLLTLLLLLLGFLCFVVGLLFTLPVIMIASALVYQTLLSAESSSIDTP